MKFASCFAVAMALSWLGAVPSVRADNIDDGLLKQGRAEKIMKHLRDHKYKNVGVLRFEVKKGQAPVTMAAGQLNGLMATRLENALIYMNDLTTPIGITRGASTVAAAKDRTATYHTNAGRVNLFKHDYPLAWGSKSVKVDGFLTGRIEISDDFSKTKVVILSFDKKDSNLQEVLNFTVDTDRATLRDMGQTFVISKRSLTLRAQDGVIDEEELDKEGQKDAQQDNKDKPDNSDPDNKNPAKPPAGSNNVTQIKEYLDFQILFDGMPANLLDHGDSARVEPPTPDQKVTITLTAKVRLGLLLRVNGINTLGEQKDERDLKEYSWWILEPNKQYTIRGFYNNDMVKQFRVLAKEDVDPSELSDNQARHGFFEFDVFVDKGADTTAAEPKIRPRQTVSLRKTTPTSATLAAAQKQLTNNLGKLAARNVFVVGRDSAAAKLETTTFEGQIHAGSAKIFYAKAP